MTAAAPAEVVAPEREYPGLSGFEWVLRPFTVHAGERLERRVSERARGLVDMTAVRADLERQLGGRLARAAARTLVLELYEARTAGRLDGTDTRARFRDFLGRTASRRGLSALLAGRPVLARILGQAALDAADALAEALERLADDHARLTAGLLGGSGADPGPLVGVESGAGDGHRGGRSVMLLRFADGTRLAYKPRPLAVHRHFNDLVAWFNELPGAVPLRTLRLLDRGDYGWVEFVAARPCASAEEVGTFYHRQGALLALLHLLDGTDLHHENLIAVGAHPVLVDVETLFHPPLPGATATEDPAARALHDSVYRVGLLPQLLVGDHSALDVSAVGGGHEAVSPVLRADWADAGTDRMRLVRRAGRFGESANRPRLAGGEPVEPGAHIDALCAGFRAGYTAIRAARQELLHSTGPLTAFTDDEVRVVMRPTWVYTLLLDESTHPDLLKHADERQRILESLRTDRFGPPLERQLVDEEIAQLWAGDVPLFTARPGQDRLWGAPGRPAAGRTDLPGIARVAAKLAALDTIDRQDQEWIVRAAMATTSRTPAHRPAEGRRAPTADRAPEPERLLSAARSVGDQLVSLAYRAGPRSNWIGLELLDDRYWRIGPMPADLAGGYTGPALFLAQLAALTGAGHYAEAARTALAPVPALLDALCARPEDLGTVGSGAFSGLGGIAYALAETARLLDDREVATWASAALRLVGAAARREREHGVGTGAAGGLVALLAAHRAGAATGAGAAGAGARGDGQETLRDARACADRLLAVDPGTVGRGFTNGAAGIGWALLRFAEAEERAETQAEAQAAAVASGAASGSGAVNGSADAGWSADVNRSLRLDGAWGAEGSWGASGSRGAAGAFGADGPWGAQGSGGTAGARGTAGRWGADGPAGMTGPGGMTGSWGADGSASAAGPGRAGRPAGAAGPGNAARPGGAGAVRYEGATGAGGTARSWGAAADGGARYRSAGLAALRVAVEADPDGLLGPDGSRGPDGGGGRGTYGDPEAGRGRGGGRGRRRGPDGGHGGASVRPADGGPDLDARASAWCRGSAGIALAVLDAPGALADPHLAAWARGTVDALGRARQAPDDSLCHGEAGLCELLGHGAVPEARPHWIRRAGALLASVEETGARSGAPDGVPHPGLLTGLAGIGHGLLRAGFPERVPSLLLLRTPGPGPELTGPNKPHRTTAP